MLHDTLVGAVSRSPQFGIYCVLETAVIHTVFEILHLHIHTHTHTHTHNREMREFNTLVSKDSIVVCCT